MIGKKAIRNASIIGIIAILLSTTFFPIVSTHVIHAWKSVAISETNGNTLYVGGTGPNNYTTIQDAIDNASDGDTIFVFNGTYYENVVVDKSIDLIGEDKNTTVINGSSKGDVVRIYADNVHISDFTIRNAWYPDAGIRISSDYNNVYNNILNSNYEAIYMYGSSRNTISGNTIKNNKGMAIFFSFWCHNNVISDNIIANNTLGIYLQGSFNNTISGNELRNDEEELYLSASSGTTVKNNNIIGCRDYAGYEVYFVIGSKHLLEAYRIARTNKFVKNYWGRPRILPKHIPGDIRYFYYPHKPPITLPSVIFDWFPAKKPYEIPEATLEESTMKQIDPEHHRRVEVDHGVDSRICGACFSEILSLSHSLLEI